MNKKTILIVEDEPAEMRALDDKLSREGFNIIRATNGKEGLETALEKHPDMILADVLMPVMDGFAMIKELRKDAWGKNAPVMILTNAKASCKKRREIASDRKCLCYLIKSGSRIQDIVERVKKELGVK